MFTKIRIKTRKNHSANMLDNIKVQILVSYLNVFTCEFTNKGVWKNFQS